MVLLAAAVCNKNGKTLLSRQFVEMTRARIEGLLAAFPKLIVTGQQHTFIETESVRYVYQPMEKLYMVLISTKASNIFEDLETLRLFARVIPEYCREMTEAEVLNYAFELLFAFDEILALGYRESVNLDQIRTFTEMDSHEEKVFLAVKLSQEREAKEMMKKRAKELQQLKRESGLKTGPVGGYGGFGSGSVLKDPIVSSLPEVSVPKPQHSKPSLGGRGLKLGSKNKDVDSFVGQLECEGEVVANADFTRSKLGAPMNVAPVTDQEGVHVKLEEKLSLSCTRDGSLESLEVQGIAYLQINDEKYTRIRVEIQNRERRQMTLQTHPHVDKKIYASDSIIAHKTPGKSFPARQDLGVLRWRCTDVSEPPLSITCWPNDNGSGGCDVNIEYELSVPTLKLENVCISVPCSEGGSLVVCECDGEYFHDRSKNILEWRIPLIDSSSSTGTLEFTAPGIPDDFFPVNVSFVSQKSFVDIVVKGVKLEDGETDVKFSHESIFYPVKYEII